MARTYRVPENVTLRWLLAKEDTLYRTSNKNALVCANVAARVVIVFTINEWSN